MAEMIWRGAVSDLTDAVAHRYVAITLARQDVVQRYRRSRIGAFWLTINMGVMIGAIGFVFGMLFRSPLQEFLPFLAAGMILWGFISSCINEGCTAFSASEGIILQVRMPLATHVLRVLLRNILIFFHNILIFPIVLIGVGGAPGWQLIWIVPGFALLVLNLFWMMLVVGVVCTRYRDMAQIVQNVMQVAFYMTPIMWMPKSLPEHAPKWLIDLNPFVHLLALVRDPLLGVSPPALSWLIALILLLLGGGFAVAFFERYRHRVAYWL